ncbi:SpoIIE family protein phosphatase [Streptomyces sp. NPDC005808]|uniref:SpoIIE family protein phosphatase n=1 Tax=Streptomyces sp. NPDC005808 TaxID=3364734 RepID=UPI0036BD35AD
MIGFWEEGHSEPSARAHERFVTGEPLDSSVRGPILRSWQRCQALGLLPDRFELPYVSDLDLGTRLMDAAAPVLGRLATTVLGSDASVVLTDGEGRLLQRHTGERSFTKHLDKIQFAPGFRYSERIAGTNAIGTALAERRPHVVLGAEHFAECLQPYACFTAPVRDPVSGRIEGAVDLTCWSTDAKPGMATVVRDAATAIERRLMEQSTDRERALLRAYMQARRGARPNTGSPHVNSAGSDALSNSELGWADQQILREKATELFSAGSWGVAEVPISKGQVVTLLCRPLVTPSGIAGAAVEAILPREPDRIVTVAPLSVYPVANTLSITSMPLPASGPADAYPTGAGAPEESEGVLPPTTGAVGMERLLLVGEPAVGKIAIRTRQRLQLLHDAGMHLGTSLDMSRTAEQLATVAVPRLADYVTVDLLDSVLHGEDPADREEDVHRIAVKGMWENCPLYPVGEVFRFVEGTPQAHCLTSGRSMLEPDLNVAPGWLAQDPVRGERLLLDHGIHSLITVPLRASGVVLGLVTFYRSGKLDPFEGDDLSLAEELVAHAAVCLDNARRYTREHAMAEALQRSLLPRGVPDHEAVEAAYRYLPARAGVGGDWFDVIPLSGARVALVVGDVVGHGIQAAATMGRLRTAIHNFSALDLPPDELLARLDDLVDRLDGEGPVEGGGPGITGSTCLYAVYDPTSGCCTMARAGHPLPAVVTPDGVATFPEMPPGPPLGLGGLPFETAELQLPAGSRLMFYTDGLLEAHRDDIDVGIEILRRTVTVPDRSAEETCDAVLDAMLPARSSDDVTLLVVRTRSLDSQQIASWDVPSDPAAVSAVRSALTRMLTEWRLDDLGFSTELILSELVTNAIRHANAPIRVRLLRTRSLICEVSDASSTSPHMRRAAMTDEGGRGLFLVAQLAQRWGTRYTSAGKVIWAEQDI